MTVPVWPDTLPQTVAQDGFSYGFGDGRLRTPMDSGPGKGRRRFSAVAKPVTIQIILDGVQLARLEEFWETDTAGGSLPFWFPNQVHQSRVVDVAGAPLLPAPKSDPWLVLFGEQPPATVPWGGLLWRASFSLAIMP